MNWLISLLAKLFGRNFSWVPKKVIVDQMLEPRALPMGRSDFEEWSNRIISGALVPGGEENKEVFHESQKFALANMILHLGPTESHKPDAFFIHALRKVAVNQVADVVRTEIREKVKAGAAVNEAKEPAVPISTEQVVSNP